MIYTIARLNIIGMLSILIKKTERSDTKNLSGGSIFNSGLSGLGIKRSRLYEIVKFYRVYPIVRALHGQLSWYHYLYLISIEDEH